MLLHQGILGWRRHLGEYAATGWAVSDDGQAVASSALGYISRWGGLVPDPLPVSITFVSQIPPDLVTFLPALMKFEM